MSSDATPSPPRSEPTGSYGVLTGNEAAESSAIFDYVSLLVDHLSWPIVILVLAFTFKGSLTRLFERIASVSWGDKQINFDRSLSEAQEYADRVMTAGQRGEFEPPKYEERLSFVRGPLETSAINPRQAIIDAWLEVEDELNNAIERLGMHVPYRTSQSTIIAIRLLRSTERLNKYSISLLNHLRQLRNRAAHDRRFDLAPEQAAEYVQLCADAIAYLRHLTPNNSAAESEP